MTSQKKWIVERIPLHACCRVMPAPDERRSDIAETESPARLNYEASRSACSSVFWLLLAGIRFCFLATAMTRAQLISKDVVALGGIISID